MKLEWKKSYLGQVATVALCSMFTVTAHAVPTVVSGFSTSATIDDAGYFSPAGSLGLSFSGREYVNHGTLASNWWLNANGAAVAVADETVGNNPLSSTAFTVISNVAIVTNLGVGGGWNIVETVSIPTDGHVAVQVQLTNNTGATANHVQWGVGVDPDQGIPAGLGFGTTNVINALGNLSSVTATSLDGWLLTLRNTTSASAFSIAPYIDPAACCSPVDPAIMLAAGQGVGNYGFADHSINLAYDLGSIPNHHSVTIGYEYVMAIPEPETYAMLLAGIGLVGFSARRRRIM
jgi:hypothetical protein